MDDQAQSPPPTEPDLSELTARHESEEPEIDPMDVAMLFNRVGSELLKVDKQSLSPGGPQAMQLTEEKVFEGVNRRRSKQPTPPPVNAAKPVAAPPPQAKTAPPLTRAVRPPPPPLVNDDTEKRIEALEKKLKKMESFSRAYNNTKKIKRGVTYSVSSNSMKGEIKDAAVLLEYVMCEISKGVKTISIKIREN